MNSQNTMLITTRELSKIIRRHARRERYSPFSNPVRAWLLRVCAKYGADTKTAFRIVNNAMQVLTHLEA